MKIRTQVKGGAVTSNHSGSARKNVRVKSAVRGGIITINHSLTVR
jgi:hypothetical protein